MASQGTSNTVNSMVTGVFLPVAPILIPLAVHFLLVCFVLISLNVVWLPQTYLFSHIFFFLIGLWTVFDNERILPVIVFIVVLGMTILLDIIQLGLYFGDAQAGNGSGTTVTHRTWQFSASMAIINLLFKPVTLALSCIAVYARTGGNLNVFGSRRDSYSAIHGTSDEQPSQ